MKTKHLLALATLLTVSTSHAQISLSVDGRAVQPMSRAEINTRWNAHLAEQERQRFPVIRTESNCSPLYSTGNDGIFARTSYCHRSNPNSLSGFLQAGNDVPASFLAGFTEAETQLKWQSEVLPPHSPIFVEEALRFELPVELMKLLNVSAAKTWEMILGCARSDADLAREMYRTAGFAGCETELQIRSNLSEIRTNLPLLAATIQPVVFLDPSNLLGELVALSGRKASLSMRSEPIFGGTPSVQATYERERLDTEERRLQRLHSLAARYSPNQIFEAMTPVDPHTHPLFAQILLEELLGQIDPALSPNRAARVYSSNENKRLYTDRLMMWVGSINERECSAFGLWPSASRTAMDALTKITTAANLRRSNARAAIIQDSTVTPKPFLQVPCASLNAPQGLRLPDIYTNAGHEIWAEFRTVRQLNTLEVRR